MLHSFELSRYLDRSCASTSTVPQKRSVRNGIAPRVGASPYLAGTSEIGQAAVENTTITPREIRILIIKVWRGETAALLPVCDFAVE